MMREIPTRAVTFVGQLEGCELVAYPDPATHGDPWTVGYGHTGPDVKPGMKITNTQATNFLRADLATARARLFGVIGEAMDTLSEAQFVALLSFVLNLGAQPNWRIWKLVRAGQFDQVPVEIQRFVNGGGRVLQGLVNRRNAECALWREGADPTPVPSSVTRVEPTPPTPTAAQSLPDHAGLLVKVGTCISGCGLVVKQVSDTVTPFAAASPHVAQIIGYLAMAGAALAVVALTVAHFQKKHA